MRYRVGDRVQNRPSAGPSGEMPSNLSCNRSLKETPLVRWFVFLCASVEEWWTQNEWIVQKTHTSEMSVSRALPQVFVSTLEHMRSRIQTIL